MHVSHTLPALSVSSDDVNLLGTAGLVPVVALASEAGQMELANEAVKLPTDKGTNAGPKPLGPVRRNGRRGRQHR